MFKKKCNKESKDNNKSKDITNTDGPKCDKVKSDKDISDIHKNHHTEILD